MWVYQKSLNLLRALLVIVMSVGWSCFSHAGANHYFQIVYDTSEPTIPGLKPDFGYAVYVHTDGKRILLDTGTNPDVIEQNLIAAGVNVSQLDMVVISHNHHDHSGGLARIRELHPDVPVYVPPDQEFQVGNIDVVEDYLRITPNIFVIRGHTKEPTAGISDDLSIVLRSSSGPYVLSTCSHSGVGHIIDRASKVTGEDVYYFSGGARLVHRPAADTKIVARDLDKRSVQVVSPSHCSLSHRVNKDFRETLGERVKDSQLGKKIKIVLPE
jgi:7,8-dihydropterin-6-yl-methyl-4-(beta-D-ribofuranosyl)aminobenzene 5'-phosphate synthase